MKPNQKTILNFVEEKRKIDEAYQRLDALIEDMVSKYGTGDHYCENPEGGWFKLTLTDNIRQLREGVEVWKSTVFKKFSASVRELKNPPKHL